MKAEHSKLMDKVVQNLDWDSILAVHKVFKMGVGEGNEIIPGLKRKPYLFMKKSRKLFLSK